MSKEFFKKINTKKEIRINPNNYGLIKSLMKELENVKNGDRLKRLHEISTEIEQITEDSWNLSKSKNIDYGTALDKVISKKKGSNPSKK